MKFTLCLVSSEDQEAAAAINPSLMVFDAPATDFPGDPAADPTAFMANSPFSDEAREYIDNAYESIESFQAIDWDDDETSIEAVLANKDLQIWTPD